MAKNSRKSNRSKQPGGPRKISSSAATNKISPADATAPVKTILEASSAVNVIRNSAALDADVSTGTMPTHWASQPSFDGLVRSVEASGFTSSGLGYVDIRYSGRANKACAVAIVFDREPAIAQQGQCWNFTFYIQRLAGTIESARFYSRLSMRDEFRKPIGGLDLDITPSNELELITSTQTISNEDARFISPQLFLGFDAEVDYDFIIRIAQPSLSLVTMPS